MKSSRQKLAVFVVAIAAFLMSAAGIGKSSDAKQGSTGTTEAESKHAPNAPVRAHADQPNQDTTTDQRESQTYNYYGDFNYIPPKAAIPESFWTKHNAVVSGISAIFVALFTGALVVTSYRQWNVAKDTAAAAKESADAMNAANALAEANAIAAERPWIGIIHFQNNEMTVDQFPTVIFNLRNFGQSPGFAVRYRTGLGVADSSLTVELWITKLAELPAQQIGTWFPSQVLSSPAQLQPPPELIAGHIKGVESGQLRLYAFGDVIYLDRAGKTHTTWISGLYHPQLRRVIPERFPGLPPDT